MNEKPREIAFRILNRWRGGADYVEKLLERELSACELSAADRGFCHELVFGAVRWQGTLDWLVARKTGGRTQNAGIRTLLHVGLYQMFWMRVPDHAAVHETVELGKRMGFGPRAGFLNGVLRGYGRERAETELALDELKRRDPAAGYSHPEFLVRRWEDRWGREASAALLDWNNRPPPVYARWNGLKGDAKGLMARWRSEGVEFEERKFDWLGQHRVFELKAHPPLAQCGSFQDGLFYVQDPSTLLAAGELAPRMGDSILDLCAAPGGKTTAIAQAVENRGRIVALDPQPGRLQLLKENCARLGATCVEMEGADGAVYDRILIDAPCSNTGVLRRRVDLRWRIQPSEWERLANTQLSLLSRAAGQVRAEGALVYSTCSLELEENEQVVKAFLEANAAYELKSQRQLTPFKDGVDGAFVATLRRKA